MHQYVTISLQKSNQTDNRCINIESYSFLVTLMNISCRLYNRQRFRGQVFNTFLCFFLCVFFQLSIQYAYKDGWYFVGVFFLSLIDLKQCIDRLSQVKVTFIFRQIYILQKYEKTYTYTQVLMIYIYVSNISLDLQIFRSLDLQIIGDCFVIYFVGYNFNQ